MTLDNRKTIRFNEKEWAELQLFKKTYHFKDDAKAIKAAISTANTYLKNVSELFFPPSCEVVLLQKRKTMKQERKFYQE